MKDRDTYEYTRERERERETHKAKKQIGERKLDFSWKSMEFR
jgi:hypothetical protein